MHHFDSLACLAEVGAVKSHFRSVLWFLRQRRPPGLDPAQRAARALLLDELEAYAARGVFPLNTHSPGQRKPTFIDEVGTRCAVAHLLDFSGQEALALEVRDRMNFAPVSEIVEEPRFVAWLEAAGFTREEIALVQPSYCEVKPLDCVCENIATSGATVALVSYRSTADGYTLTEVHRAAPGVEVGAKLVSESGPPKQAGVEHLGWVFAPSEASGPNGTLRIVDGARRFTVTDGITDTCQSWGATSLPLAKADAIKALLSPSYDACVDYLTSLDDRWDDTPGCGSGCDMTDLAGSSPASLTVLAAIVGAIAARRRRPR